jgi:hypothetical protein
LNDGGRQSLHLIEINIHVFLPVCRYGRQAADKQKARCARIASAGLI